MTPEQARQLDALYKGMFYGSQVRGKEYPGLLAIEAETQRRVTLLSGQNAGLAEAVKQLAAGRELDLEAVQRAAEAGTTKALEEGTVDVDITVTGRGTS